MFSVLGRWCPFYGSFSALWPWSGTHPGSALSVPVQGALGPQAESRAQYVRKAHPEEGQGQRGRVG